jgi:hypothetical protein
MLLLVTATVGSATVSRSMAMGTDRAASTSRTVVPWTSVPNTRSVTDGLQSPS